MGKIYDEDYAGDKTSDKSQVALNDLAMLNKKEMTEQYPTEDVELPSKGLCYPENNPLSKGVLKLRYMTAKDEDILTSENLIKKGTAIDKLLQNLIVDDIDFNDLILGDKNAIMVAVRIMAYGKDYPIEVTCPRCGVVNQIILDLTEFDDKAIDEGILNRLNEYEFELPFTKKKITFKLLTQLDDRNIEQELRGLKKLDSTRKDKSNIIEKDLSTRLKYIITSINGNRESQVIRRFVDNEFLTRDNLEFRKYLSKITPNLDLNYEFECGDCEYTAKQRLPITVEFFWPNSDVQGGEGKTDL